MLETPLSFGAQELVANYLRDCDEKTVNIECIVLNLADTAICVEGTAQSVVLPWQSAYLRCTTLRNVKSALMLQPIAARNVGGIILNSPWKAYFGDGDRTPLYVSSEATIGPVTLDLSRVPGILDPPKSPVTLQTKLRVWFAPSDTDCKIHTAHPFLEVHTQLFGTGFMQKFALQREDTLYQNVAMPVGYTHQPFFTFVEGALTYPWHRYLSASDCIWLATEFYFE